MTGRIAEFYGLVRGYWLLRNRLRNRVQIKEADGLLYTSRLCQAK
jgi:hypothetical protein